MANVKISNLTAATTPVAGTEVLPIVQSSATVKVSIANLTAGRSVSATGLALTGSTSGTVTLTAKAVAGSTTFKLPAADGTSNQAMVTDGSGNLSFATVGAGDVVGPASATANGIALFNSTTGKLIKDSAASDGLIYGLTVGRGAGAINTNTALGASALAANTSGYSNFAGGWNALTANTTGDSSVAVGVEALVSNTTGSANTATGSRSLRLNTTGSYNTAFGRQALESNTTGSGITGIGYQAGYLTTVGPNTYVGSGAGYGQTGGYSNVAVGYRNLGYAGGGASYLNVAVGDYALQNLSTGQSNVAIGYLAGQSHTTGTYGIYIGPEAGKVITTGNGTYIGAIATASAAGVTSEMVISTGTNQVGKGANTGFISPNVGAVYQGNNASTWSTTSDRRLKKNIVDNIVGLDAITAIRVRNFEYRLPEEVDAELKPTDAIAKSGIQLGVIAQELNEVLPDCVKTETTGVMAVNADNLTWYLVNAIKELNAKVQALEAQINGA